MSFPPSACSPFESSELVWRLVTLAGWRVCNPPSLVPLAGAG